MEEQVGKCGIMLLSGAGYTTEVSPVPGTNTNSRAA